MWKNSKFPTFKPYTVSEKMLYHQKYSTDFQKLPFFWKTRKIGIWPKEFHGRSYFSFARVSWKLFSSGRIRNFLLSSCTLCQKKGYITKGISNRFSKTFLLLKDVENRYLSRKSHWRSYFSFSMVRWKLFSGGKILSFPLSSCTLFEKKCYITKGIQPIFKNIPSAERCGK